MPTSLNPLRYPTEFADLFSLVVEQGRVEIPRRNYEDASSLRLQLYGYRNAIQAAPAGFEKIALMADAFKMKIRQGDGVVDTAPWFLIIEISDDSEEVAAIREVLNNVRST